MLGEIIRAGQRNEGYIKFERDFATHPLPGVDVPFQSRYLCAGVKPFRACKTTPALYELRLLMNLSQIYQKRSRLRTSILTCLLGNTFQISFPSRSASLTNACNAYTTRRHLFISTSDRWADATTAPYIILVELLAYQLASPVKPRTFYLPTFSRLD
jgi:fatty acid synthase subunit alpha